jgi:hypothetical protein
MLTEGHKALLGAQWLVLGVSDEKRKAAHDGRRLRRASSEKKAVRPPPGYPYDPSGYGACFGAKWWLPGRAGAGRCRRTPEQGWG